MDDIKAKIIVQCKLLLLEKEQGLMHVLEEIMESMSQETKSSVGDKHETARAKMQYEQEKLSKQLGGIREQIKEMHRILNLQKSHLVNVSSLVTTNRGVFFIVVALGKIETEAVSCYAISPQSPLALKMQGLGINQSFDFNGLSYQIENIC